MRVEFLAQALEDLERIHEPLHTRILKFVGALGDYPDMGAPMTGRLIGYRSFVIDFYRVVYFVEPDAVVIAYFRACRRKPLH